MTTLADIDETLPVGTEVASNGDNRIRNERLAIKTTVGLEHQLTGEHKFPSGTTANRPAAGKAGRIYLNTDTKVIEKDNGTTWEGANVAFPSGTRMVFHQASAPVGWTIDSSLNDKTLMINSASGGASGGSWTISGMNSGGAHTHTTAGHTLTIAEMPSHTHSIYGNGWQNGGASGAYGDGGNVVSIQNGATGGGGSHSHGNTGSAGSHTHTFNGAWRPAYTNIILASKD